MQKKHGWLVAVGARIRVRRLESGQTQDDVAHGAGLHITYFSAVERGERNFGVVTLLKIARHLKVSTGDLLPLPSELGPAVRSKAATPKRGRPKTKAK